MPSVMGISARTAYGGGETSRQRWERTGSRKKIEEEGVMMEERGYAWPLYGCFGGRSVKARASSYYCVIRVNARSCQVCACLIIRARV